MKLHEIYDSINELNFKNSFDGEFKVWKFYDSNNHIGNVFLRLKKGWNQLHIEVNEKFQRKGYSIQMIRDVINDVDYISIPEGRILNNAIYKIIDKFKKDNSYEVWKTKYDEWIISNKKQSKKKINLVFI